MSARDETHKSQRYRLGELLRDSADNMLLLTATPHKGDPHNFTLFLQLLDQRRLRRREVHTGGNGAQAGALLPAPHQGGDGLLPGAAAGRAVDRQARVHETDYQHRRFLD